MKMFMDTAGWLMLADASDKLHITALETRDKWLEEGGIFISTDYVLDETITLIRMRLGIDAAEEWWKMVSSSSRIQWEWMNSDRIERAMTWFFRWRDKKLSFTDCTSFALMKELKLSKALTCDKHFKTAGFEIYPPG